MLEGIRTCNEHPDVIVLFRDHPSCSNVSTKCPLCGCVEHIARLEACLAESDALRKELAGVLAAQALAAAKAG